MNSRALLVAAAIAMAHMSSAVPQHGFFECSSGEVPDKLLWQTETGMSSDLCPGGTDTISHAQSNCYASGTSESDSVGRPDGSARSN